MSRNEWAPMLSKFGDPQDIVLVGKTRPKTYKMRPRLETYQEADASLDLTGPAGFRGFGDRWAPLRREQPLSDNGQNVTIKEV